MVKNLPLLRRAGNNGRPWVHDMPLCVTHIQRHMYDNTRFNLVKSVNWYRLHMTVRRTTRAYNGTMATKGLFIMCPSANIIGIRAQISPWLWRPLPALFNVWLLSKCKKSEKTSECQFTRKRVKATQKKLLCTRKREKREKKVRFFTRKRVKKEWKWTRVNTTQKCIVLRLNL